MDIFVEQIVKKETGGKDTAKKAVIVILTSLIAAVLCFAMMLFPFASIIVLALIFGLFYLSYRLLSNFSVEYEYIVTNGEMDVDKIVARSKRTRLVTVKAASFEAFGKYSSASEAEDGTTIVSASGISLSGTETELWYADLTHPSAGKVRLIFSPEDKVIEALRPFLPRQLKVNLNK